MQNENSRPLLDGLSGRLNARCEASLLAAQRAFYIQPLHINNVPHRMKQL